MYYKPLLNVRGLLRYITLLELRRLLLNLSSLTCAGCRCVFTSLSFARLSPYISLLGRHDGETLVLYISRRLLKC